jgi:hypothetical protein
MQILQIFVVHMWLLHIFFYIMKILQDIMYLWPKNLKFYQCICEIIMQQ